MRKRTLLLIVVTLLAVFVYYTPKILNHKHFQDRVTRELITAFGVDCRLATIQWHWFPLPGLYIEHFKSNSASFTLDVPKIRLVPNLISLLRNKGPLGRIKLINPRLQIKEVKGTVAHGFNIHFPDVKLIISDGTITFPQLSMSLPSGPIALQPVQVSKLNLNTTISGNALKFNGAFTSNISEKIEAIGRIDLTKKYYRLDLEATKANLAPLGNQTSKNLQFAESDVSLRLHLEGIGPDNFKFTLSEIDTPLSYTLFGQPYTISSIGSVGFTRHGQEIFLIFDHCKFANPAVSFSGKVSKRLNNVQNSPAWNIDISAVDLDLKEIRQRVLSLWPDNQAAVTTCAIVLGGSAKTAHYTFNGPAADFEFLSRMKIWAEVVDVPLFIPSINLHIDKASGPITIIDGYLAGKDLKADIASSHGQNAALWLDLIEQDDAFYLDIDLDTDLADLKKVLETIIQHKPFQRELEQFSTISGRAKGKLTIGNTLTNLETTVNIDYLSAEGVYKRLPWPFKLNGTRLDISPHMVQWSDIQATLGPQTIKKLTGEVNWEHEPTIRINQFEATADLKTFFDQSFLVIHDHKYFFKKAFTEALSSISGRAEFRDGHFSGPALSPEQWKFQTDFTLIDTVVESRHLPPGVVSEIVQGTLNEKSITFSGIFAAFDQGLFMSANYHHRLFDSWSGSLTLDGTIKEQMGEWLRSTGWIPAPYFPKIPLTLTNFQISNQASSFKEFSIKGALTARNNQADAKTMQIDMNIQKNLTLHTLSFVDEAGNGKFSYMYQPKAERSLITWQGDVNMKTLDAFFEKNIFHEGVVHGVFNRLNDPRQAEQTTYSGYLEANDLQWSIGSDLAPIIGRDISLSGENQTIHLNTFSADLDGDRLNITGDITDDSPQIAIDLALTANNLSLNTLQKVLTLHKKFFTQPPPPPCTSSEATPESDSPTLSKNLNGTLTFKLDALHYTTKPTLQDNLSIPSLPRTYTLNNISGDIDFAEHELQMKLLPTDLCGMKLSGTYFSDSTKKNDSFWDVGTGSDDLLFDNVLPCLGQDTSVIKGPFRIKAHLEGYPHNWHSGELALSSASGIIKKMNLLSKIFSVVNFTDMFTWGEPPDIDGKGLMYTNLLLRSHITDNSLVVDRANLKGKGVNLSGRGTIDLSDANFNSEMTFFVAPFRLIDSIIGHVPLVGKAIGGDKESIFTFPVGMKGPINNPTITALPPSAIGNATFEFIRDTLTLPFRILFPDPTTPDPTTPPSTK